MNCRDERLYKELQALITVLHNEEGLSKNGVILLEGFSLSVKPDIKKFKHPYSTRGNRNKH